MILKNTEYRKFFITMLALILLVSFTSMITPVFLQLCDSFHIALTSKILLILAVVIVLSKLFGILVLIFRERFAEAFNKRNCADMLRDMLHMNYDAITKDGPTALFERISMSVNDIYNFMTGGFINICSGTAELATTLVLIGLADWRISLCLLLLIPLNYGGYKLLNKELTRRSLVLQEDTSASFQEIISYLQQVDSIKQLSGYDCLLQKLQPSVNKSYRSMASINVFAQSVSAGLSGLNDIARNFSMIYLAWRFATMQAGAYSLILLTTVLPLYFSALSKVVHANVNRQSFDTAMNFWKSLRESRETDGERTLQNVDDISLSVSKIPVPGKEIAFPVRGRLKKGDIAQICGESGAGKSSFAKALVKFRACEGIFINGIPLRQIQNSSLRGHVEYIPQTVPIVRGTLRDNLFLLQPWTPELEQKAKADPILKTILQNKTLNSEILEGGTNLSGGEKQKIAIVRALMTEADVLILDEVCSNIDAASSEAIYERIALDRNKRIVFVISHDRLPDGFANVAL